MMSFISTFYGQSMAKAEVLKDPIADYIRDHRLPGLMPVGDVKIEPSGLIMPKEFVPYLDRIKNFEVRPDDTWVISFPKCGTTWTQEMVWLLCNDLDYEASNNKLLLQRFPFLEAVCILSDELKQGTNPDDDWIFQADTINYIAEQKSPRFIKTHLPVSLLPDQIWSVKPKIIYVTRNPKDVAVSYYHHHRLWNGYTGMYPLFMQAFLQDKLVYSPFWEHVIEYKKLEKEPNILINSFEDMKSNLFGIIQKTADFLGKHYNEDEFSKLAEHLSFNKMKENSAINGEEVVEEVRQRHKMDSSDPGLCFLRKGQVDSWKDEMTPDIAKQFDAWTTKKTKGTVLEKLADIIQRSSGVKVGSYRDHSVELPENQTQMDYPVGLLEGPATFQHPHAQSHYGNNPNPSHLSHKRSQRVKYQKTYMKTINTNRILTHPGEHLSLIRHLFTMSNRKEPLSQFIQSIHGRPVVVKLNSGVDYRGVLACLDGYMNIALEQTEEYVNGQLKDKYGDAFLRGNNVLYISSQKRRYN
ncbi:hypothetical protein GE061_006212 [Apolygus lucorum]|uniref:U6 snRNA-associated Sm-like protein LSm6 n=1 Tax=Apolygus lucorum TaxID=248454 RepID=A0A8S9WUM0_APOLU|nr:hypothetical protein GE061_006212 [Apolygus lucorum]